MKLETNRKKEKKLITKNELYKIHLSNISFRLILNNQWSILLCQIAE